MKAIAIVAQEEETFEFLGYLLTKEGYEARLFRDPAVLSSKLRAFAPKLVILESGGFITNIEATCSRIRSRGNFRSYAFWSLPPNPARPSPTRHSRIVPSVARGQSGPFGCPRVPLALFLASHASVSWSREELIRAAWPDAQLLPASVDVLVRRIRNRIEEDPKKPTLVCGEAEVGYRFAISSND